MNARHGRGQPVKDKTYGIFMYPLPITADHADSVISRTALAAAYPQNSQSSAGLGISGASRHALSCESCRFNPGIIAFIRQKDDIELHLSIKRDRIRFSVAVHEIAGIWKP